MGSKVTGILCVHSALLLTSAVGKTLINVTQTLVKEKLKVKCFRHAIKFIDEIECVYGFELLQSASDI